MLIDKWGNVYEGRHGRGGGNLREAFSQGIVAGHALQHNYGSLGVALLGTFTKPGEGEPGVPPTPAMIAALADVLSWESQRNNIDPTAASDFLLTTDDWNAGLRNLSGHRDCLPTICPGGYVYELLPALRTSVASLRGPTPPAISFKAFAGRRATPSSAAKIQFEWKSAGGPMRFLHLLEGWRRYPGSEDVEYLSGLGSDGTPDWKVTEKESASFAQLYGLFGRLGEEPPPGRYSFQVIGLDARGNQSAKREHTILVAAAGNTAPAVKISAPSESAMFNSRIAVQFEGAAFDEEDGDLTYKLVWSSSVQGQIGTGGSFRTMLSPGEHVITASVSDADGVAGVANLRLRMAP
jgi:hypothetical protein